MDNMAITTLRISEREYQDAAAERGCPEFDKRLYRAAANALGRVRRTYEAKLAPQTPPFIISEMPRDTTPTTCPNCDLPTSPGHQCGGRVVDGKGVGR